MQVLCIGLLSRHISFLSNVVFPLSHLCFLCSDFFPCLPPGFASNHCWSQVLNAAFFFLPGDGQHNFICTMQYFWLCSSPLMNWQSSASSNIFCLSQVFLLHSEMSRGFMKLWFSTAGERRPSSRSTKGSHTVERTTVENRLLFFPFPYDFALTPTPTPPAWEFEMKT